MDEIKTFFQSKEHLRIYYPKYSDQNNKNLTYSDNDGSNSDHI